MKWSGKQKKRCTATYKLVIFTQLPGDWYYADGEYTYANAFRVGNALMAAGRIRDWTMEPVEDEVK